MSLSSSDSIRHKLYDYIRLADDKMLYAIYDLLEGEIEEMNEWWKDKGFVQELDRCYEELEAGTDKGLTVEQLVTSIDRLREKR